MNKMYEEFLQKRKKEKALIILVQLALLFFILFMWELASYLGIIDEFIFSKPSKIWALAVQYMKNGEIFRHTLISTYEVVLGLVLGSLLGILIAIVLYQFNFLARILDPFLIVLNALPKTALAPIFIIWIGTNTRGIVFVAISISLVITIINSYEAFNSVDEEKIKLLKALGANRWQILSNLILPANIDAIISIIKINIGMSWIGVIVGEFIVSKAGLGYLITYGTQVFRLDLVMLGVVALAIVTMLMYGLLNVGVLLYKKFRGW